VAPRFHQFLKTLPDNKGLTAIELRQLLKIRITQNLFGRRMKAAGYESKKIGGYKQYIEIQIEEIDQDNWTN